LRHRRRRWKEHHEPDRAPPAGASAAEAALADVTARSIRRENRRVGWLVLAAFLLLAVSHVTPLGAWIGDIQQAKDWLRGHGWTGRAVFAAACALGVLSGLPRLPLCAAGGLLFGFAAGLPLSWFGTAAGSYGVFLLARAGARRAVLARAASLPWLARLLEQPSVLRIFWARQLMLPGLLINVLLGVTRVGHRAFWFGTLLGYLPLNIAFTLVGSGLGKGSLAHGLAQLLGALGPCTCSAGCSGGW
jgi:uncharacterized membrane protein YdjX (TVP38/TMEM64 family)